MDYLAPLTRVIYRLSGAEDSGDEGGGSDGDDDGSVPYSTLYFPCRCGHVDGDDGV